MKFKQRLSFKVFMAFCFIVSCIFVTGGGNISFVVSSPEAALADGLVDYYQFNGNANYAGTGSIDEGFIEETTEEENIDDVITKKTEGENQNCATVDEQISIYIPSAEFGTARFSMILDIYNNTVDSESIYFKLNGFPEISESAVSSSFLDETLNINISCIAFNGSKYTLFLERYINPLDNEWFYWKVIKIELLAESDNTNASKFKNTKATYKPNLTPYKPSGWSDKIVVSTTTGTTTDSSTLYNTDTLYVDWAVINNGTSSISTKFYTKLYVDGVEKTSWNTNSLSTNYYVYVKDYSIGKLSAGTHTIKIKTDSTGVISESNESDNEYTKTITVKPPSQPNLTPYTLSGWSDKIVVSTTTGTTTNSSTLSPTDTLYVDWAYINNGSTQTSTIKFYTKLYVDGVEKASIYGGQTLPTNYYVYETDSNIGKLTVGTHSIKIKVDATGLCSESNENDNEYSKTITIERKDNQPTCAMRVVPVLNWYRAYLGYIDCYDWLCQYSCDTNYSLCN